MNFNNLPYDMHDKICSNIKNNNDLINLSKTNKYFKEIIEENFVYVIPEMFRVLIVIEAKIDINKHCEICKKFNKIKKYFNPEFYKLDIKRYNTTIFDSYTTIHFNIFIDNYKNFNKKFSEFLLNNNLYNFVTKYRLRNNLFFYLNKESMKTFKYDNLNFKKSNIIFKESSLKMLKDYNFNISREEKHRFIEILFSMTTKFLEVKKLLINNFKYYNPLVIDKQDIYNDLLITSQYHKNEREMINKEILQIYSYEVFNQRRIDELREELLYNKNMARYYSSLLEYLKDDKININSIPIFEI